MKHSPKYISLVQRLYNLSQKLIFGCGYAGCVVNDSPFNQKEGVCTCSMLMVEEKLAELQKIAKELGGAE